MSAVLMKQPKVDVSEERGERIAAYVHLASGGKVDRTDLVDDVLAIDYDAQGVPVGVEVLDFDERTVTLLNEFLSTHGYAAVKPEQLAGRAAAPSGESA